MSYILKPFEFRWDETFNELFLLNTSVFKLKLTFCYIKWKHIISSVIVLKFPMKVKNCKVLVEIARYIGSLPIYNCYKYKACHPSTDIQGQIGYNIRWVTSIISSHSESGLHLDTED